MEMLPRCCRCYGYGGSLALGAHHCSRRSSRGRAAARWGAAEGAGHGVVDVRVAHDTIHGVDVERVLAVAVVGGGGPVEGGVLVEAVRREEALLDHLDEALVVKVTDEHLARAGLGD
eukprot:scaffold88042_cov63-Phaeocystis_antarctica.AAC.1